jgi:prepilin-type N-terminal cleavage/methylation domain-containing protein
VRRRVHRLRSDESGFTLVELLAAMSIGLIVLMGAFFLLDRATSVSQELTNRQDALQRGRLAMEKIVRDLRSQVCLGDENEPITTAQNDKVTFYVDLSDGSRTIEQRTIRYVPTDPMTTSPGSLYEDVYAGAGIYPTLTFNGAPQTRLLVSGVEPIMDAGVPRPILRYYAFKPAGLPGDLELLTAPLVPNDAVRTVMVKVGFVVRPERKAPKNSEKTTLESDIYVRLADPSRPLEGPRCV